MKLRICLTIVSLLLLTGLPAGAETPVTAKPVPREGGWKTRHELINSRAKEGNKDVIFLGDSITQGWEGAGKEAWAKFFDPLKPMNAGIGGDRTEHVLWRIENGNLDGVDPKVAVIMIGTNNSGSNSADDIAAGVKAIVAKLREKEPQMKILLLAIFPRGANSDDARRKVCEAATAKFKDAADGKMVHYLDIGPKFLGADGSLSKEIMPDLLHLSPAGYTIWAENVTPKIKELLAN